MSNPKRRRHRGVSIVSQPQDKKRTPIQRLEDLEAAITGLNGICTNMYRSIEQLETFTEAAIQILGADRILEEQIKIARQRRDDAISLLQAEGRLQPIELSDDADDLVVVGARGQVGDRVSDASPFQAPINAFPRPFRDALKGHGGDWAWEVPESKMIVMVEALYRSVSPSAPPQTPVTESVPSIFAPASGASS